MEKRGFLRAGPWTPEATCEFPEAVLNMHREFGHAGCDAHQVFSFYASEDKLSNRGNEAAAKQYDMPVVATMCINKHGDLHGTSAGECAKAMAGAGADLVGINCHFDPFVSLEAMEVMRDALEHSGHMKNPDFHLAVQPLAYWRPECGTAEGKQGFIDLPEFPFALEGRLLTRWEIQRFAREAWEMGIRFIG